MRRIIIFILLFQSLCLCTQAQTDLTRLKITIKETNVPVEKILSEITRQSGLEFSYRPIVLNKEERISFSIKKASLEKTLDKFSEQLDIVYSIIENQIVLNLPMISKEESEEYFTLSGFVNDEASGESLIGAAISISGTSRGVFTNAFGFYSLQIKKGTTQVTYSYVGYEAKKVDLQLEDDQRQNMSMAPGSVDLPDVIVEQQSKNILDKKQLGEMELSPDKLNNMPEFGGESGLVKGLQSLPGIKMHSDGSAFYYTRGGERDQNLLIIDDAPIYNPSHLFGFYSIVVPSFTKSIKVYKSDIPTNLGDRLSSIVSIRTKDGNLNKFEFNGAVNPLVYRFSIETPTVKKKGSIFASIRRSNFEWLYKKRSSESEIFFSDFNFKWNHKISDKDRVYFTTIFSADNFTNRPGNNGSGVRWINFAATLRWNHLFGPKLFSNTTIYTGNYAYRLLFAPNYWQSGLGTLSFKTDFTHYVSPVFKAKFGLEFNTYFINPGSLSIDTTIAVFPTIASNNAKKTVLYYQGEYDLSEKIKIKGGLRFLSWRNFGSTTYYNFDDQYEVEDTVNVKGGVYNRYVNLDPRISAQYELDRTSQVKLSYGIYHQYLQLISNSESPFTSLEVWLPASPNIKPQAAHQVAFNYLKYFEKPKLEFSTAVYYKKFNRQIDYVNHAVTLLNPLVEGELRFGKMQSYGIEFLLKKDLGRLNGWIGYTYSRTMRRTEGINNGEAYPAFQDRPHDFSALLNYRISRRVFCSGYYTAYTGSSFSAPTGFYTFNDQTVPLYDKKNNARLPAYRRFDLAFKFILNKKETNRYQHSLTFSIYNFFAHKNVIAVNFNKIPVAGSRPVVKANLLSEDALVASQLDLIRFFPSLTYKFKL